MEIIHFADENWSQAAVNSGTQILRQIHNFAVLFNNQMTVDSSICHLLSIYDSKIFSIKPASICIRIPFNIQSFGLAFFLKMFSS